ncbi:hypothetical protein BY996DRAFT_6519935 [Phakopsora pachyrhizi]|nr:hypothetical protein BY996DRAFT_6519935 [Phakopsora pachyrhizi]
MTQSPVDTCLERGFGDFKQDIGRWRVQPASPLPPPPSLGPVTVLYGADF